MKAAGTSASANQGTHSTSATTATAVAGAEKYETKLERRGGKVRIDPAPASYAPRISQAQALAAFKTQALFPETARTWVADVQLGLFTDDETNFTGPAVYFSRPAWVIRYDNVPSELPRTGGTPSLASSPPSAAPNPDGRHVNILAFVDADTGQYLSAIEDPVDSK